MPEQQRALIRVARDPLHVIVFGVPVAKGRPRARVMRKKVFEGGRLVTKHIPQLYTPDETSEAEASLAEAVLPFRPVPVFSCPLRVDLVFYLPMLQSFSAGERARAESGALRPAVKPDGDNYVKLVFDALNGVVWRDDALIVSHHADKFYGREPRTEITVTPLAEE